MMNLVVFLGEEKLKELRLFAVGSWSLEMLAAVEMRAKRILGIFKIGFTRKGIPKVKKKMIVEELIHGA